MVKIIIFAAVSAGIIRLSWSSLRNPHAHGFFRFFVFELLLILVLFNTDAWFRNPFSVNQIVSWLLLFSSFVLAIHGFVLLFVIGKPKGDFENTTILVMRGAYKYIRHPLYSSLLLGGWGVFFKAPSILGGILALAASAFVIATAKAEEAENLRNFGADYESYMKSTSMFVPYLF